MNSTAKLIGLLILLFFIITVSVFSFFLDFKKPSLDRNDVEKIVDSYIKENPEVVFEALTRYEEKAIEQANLKTKDKIQEFDSDINNNPTDPIAGNSNGDVTIVEFFDYSCGYCKRVTPTINSILEEDKNIKVVFKELPILSEISVEKAKAALTVFELDKSKYLKFHNDLMKQNIRNQDQLINLVKSYDFNIENFKKTMESDKISNKIDENRNLARSIGVKGTPAFVINGEFIGGAISLDVFKEQIKLARTADYKEIK